MTKPIQCCEMRNKVALGIVNVFSESECGIPDSVMADFHDFSYKSPTKLTVAAALSFRFCPWCGAERKTNEARRVTEMIRPKRHIT